MQEWYADFHIHIGSTRSGRPVKISASRDLRFASIAEEASKRKGLDMVGIIDCQVPEVQDEMETLLANGQMQACPGGGIRYERTVIIPGCEMELKAPHGGLFHVLAYFPTLANIRAFSQWLGAYQRNPSLSSQRTYADAKRLQQEVEVHGGIFIPAHIFTPFKSVYGSGGDHIGDLLDTTRIAAVELGLSADTAMADQLPELARYAFLSNSDAHSLRKIGREYNCLRMEEATFDGLCDALAGRNGAAVAANYGLNPHLGKYHRTYCRECAQTIEVRDREVMRCPHCGGGKLVRGVADRIATLAAAVPALDTPPLRPPYHYQVPLEFIPGLGPAAYAKLLAACGTEMQILHEATVDQLTEAVGRTLADYVLAARDGRLRLRDGGGGRYGTVEAGGYNE